MRWYLSRNLQCEASESLLRPARASQFQTSVAPFQLIHSLILLFDVLTTTLGAKCGYAVHGKRNER